MLTIGAFSVAVGVLCFVLLAIVSLRGPRSRRRRLRDSPMYPLVDHDHHHTGDDGGSYY